MALTTTELAEFARRSRELMNSQGKHWIKGDYKSYGDDYTADARYCSVGAVRETIFGETEDICQHDPRYQAVLNALDDAIREEMRAGRYIPVAGRLSGDPETVIVNFNDDAATTWPDVERVFRRAEEILSAEAA